MNSVSGHTTPANITQLNVANSRISHIHFRKSVLIPKLCALRLHYAPPRRRENSKMAFHPTSFPSLFLPAQSITGKRGGRFFTVSFKIVLILKKPRTNRPRYSPFASDAPTLFFLSVESGRGRRSDPLRYKSALWVGTAAISPVIAGVHIGLRD